MNVPPGYNQQPNVPPGYGAPQQGYPPQGQYSPPQGYTAMPQSGPYMPPPPPPHGFRGATRMMFNPASYRQPGTGAFGTSSLIISIVSIFLCGILSPISLLLGFAGLIGKKTHKGAALAGVIISIIPAAFWIFVMTFGLHHAFNSDKYALQATAPVVAAIDEYKKDHEGTVPPSLETLVEEGYLPARWNAGLDDLDSPVKSLVEGKEWKEFLQYGPGTSVAQAPRPRRAIAKRGQGEDSADWLEGSEYDTTDETPAKTGEKTYILKFIGVDNSWSTADDRAAVQNPEKKFDLSVFGGSNSSSMRELAQTKRKLEAAQKDAMAKIGTLNKNDLPKAQARLTDNEKELKKLAAKKNLQSKAAVKGDKDCAVWLKAIGQELQVIAAIENKIQRLESSLNSIKGSLANLRSQEAMAKLADNKQELAELQALLDDTTKELAKDDTSEFLGETKEAKAADDWLSEQYR
ncbi:hypothetical protein PLCT2_02260 [Planctomycetaceae bacterium]|nr:hypothetical protein PLCT2_02260 [Planctomycetaceae bacterium]